MFHALPEGDLLNQFIGNQKGNKTKENKDNFFFNLLKYKWIVRKVRLHNDGKKLYRPCKRTGLRAYFKRQQRHENTELFIKQVLNLEEPSQHTWMYFLCSITKVFQPSGREIIPTLFIGVFPQLSRRLNTLLNVLQGNIILCYISLSVSRLFSLG